MVGIILSFKVVFNSLGLNFVVQNVWIILPILFIALFLPRYILNIRSNFVVMLVCYFLVVLVYHMIVQGRIYGIIAGIWAFIAYGLWLGLFAWIQYASPKSVRSLAINMFIWIALLHGLITIFEYLFMGGLYKTVTINNITRHYGLSFSVAILGLQLAVGLIVLFKVYLTKENYRISILAGFLVVEASLLLISVRGPILYTIIAFSLIFAAKLQSKKNECMRILVLTLCGLTVIVLFIVFNGIDLGFYLGVFSSSDAGNQIRLDRYAFFLKLIQNDWWAILIGAGSGEYTQVAILSSREELSIESSFLKSILELGILGVLPIVAITISVFWGLIKHWSHPLIKQHIELFAVLLLILLQCITHETFKTWIGSFYLVISLGLCVRILTDIGFFRSILDRQKRN